MTNKETYDIYFKKVSDLIQRNLINIDTIKELSEKKLNTIKSFPKSILDDEIIHKGKNIPSLIKKLSILKEEQEAIDYCIRNYNEIKGELKITIENNETYKNYVKGFSDLIKKDLINLQSLIDKLRYKKQDMCQYDNNFRHNVIWNDIFSLTEQEKKLVWFQALTKALEYCIDNFKELKQGGQK